MGIVGEDFPKEHIDLFRSRGIDLDGLQIAPGKTFAWTGEYSRDMNSRTTLSVELNVFEKRKMGREWVFFLRAGSTS